MEEISVTNKQMDINDIYDKTIAMVKDKEKPIEASVELFFIKESDNGNNILLYRPQIDKGIPSDLITFFTNAFQMKSNRDKIQEEYDVVMQHQGNNFVIVEKDKFDGTKIFWDLIEKEEYQTTMKGYSTEDFFAYGFKVKLSNDQWFAYIGELSSLSRLSKTKILGNLSDDRLKKVEKKDHIGFNKNMSMILSDDQILIKNIRIFEKFCDMDTEFIKQSKLVLESIKAHNAIKNIDKLEITASDDPRIARRLTKLNNDPTRVSAFFGNIKNVNKVLKDKEFSEHFKGIKFDGKQLEYDEKLRQQFITLIADAAYKSIVGNKKRIDKSL